MTETYISLFCKNKWAARNSINSCDQPSANTGIFVEASSLVSINFFVYIDNFLLSFLSVQAAPRNFNLSYLPYNTQPTLRINQLTMFFHLFPGLATLVFFLVDIELASALFAGQINHPHRHSLRSRPQEGRYHQRTSRSDATLCAVSQVELQAFQVETRAFQDWIRTWLFTADKIDSKSAIAQVRQEFQAYNMWAERWLDSHISVEGLPQFPGNSSISVPIPITTASKSAQVYISNIASPVSNDLSAQTSPSLPSSPGLPAISPITTAPTSAQKTLPVIVTAIRSSLNSSTATPTPVFPQPKSKHNELVVYYGQSVATAETTLLQVCENKNVDMVILAFLTHFSGPADYPIIDFGAACGGQTPKMQSAGATGLLSCPLLASYIAQCQKLGKKVLLSLGGATSDVALPHDENAKTIAKQLWNLFGAGKGEDPGLRPFGNVTLDGFDIGGFYPSLCNQLAVFPTKIQYPLLTHVHPSTNIAFLLFR